MSRQFDRCLDVLAMIAGVLMVLVAIIVSVGVVARYFFGGALAWTFNISQHTLLYFVFLATAWVLREDGHVNIDLVEVRLAPRQRSLLRLITSFMALIACAVLFWSSLNAVLRSFHWGSTLVGPPPVPEFVLLAVIPFGSFLLIVQFGRRCWKYINALRA